MSALRISVPDLKTSTLADYRNFVRRYGVRDVLRSVGWLSSSMEKQGERFQGFKIEQGGRRWSTTIGQWGLAFLASEALREGRIHGGRDIADADIDGFMLEAQRLYDGLPDGFRTGDDEWLTLLRRANEQLHWRARPLELVARALVLYEDIAPHCPGVKIDAKALIADRMGLSIAQFFRAGFLVYLAATKGPVKSERAFSCSDNELTNKLGAAGTVRAFVTRVGLPLADFRSPELLGYAVDPESPRASFNPLTKFPVVHVNRWEWIAPIPRLVLERATSGLFYDLYDEASDPEVAGNDWGADYGKIFEAYVGEQLHAHLTALPIYPEPKYGKSEKAGPDWIVDGGDLWIAIECRSGGFKIASRAGADSRGLISDLRRVFGDTVAKYPGKVADLRAGRMGVEVPPSAAVYPLIVSNERIYSPEALTAFGTGSGALPKLDEVAIIDVEDLEQLLSLPEPLEALRSWWPDRHRQSLTAHLAPLTRAPDGTRYRNRLLEGAHRKLFEEFLPNDEW